ncbi:TPA: ribbon-helix-helix protein, CopG family [Candidatus Bathyarchaeota archaeon]|nr:ribbon-helix-helix protein, CopG family [Candidatus Bathyarchaeota archaeon]
MFTKGCGMTQVQVRMPEKLIKEIDRWIAEGRFRSRSDAIKTIVAIYEERERTREFYKMLVERSKEAEEKPDILVPLEEIP